MYWRFLVLSCHYIQTLLLNFVSRKFNNIRLLYVMKKEIRKVRTVRIIFLALTSFAVPVRNLSCQSRTRRITRRTHYACRNIATVKIERFCWTKWAKRGCKFARHKETERERKKKWKDKIEAKEHEDRNAANEGRVPLAAFLLLRQKPVLNGRG